MSDWDTLMSMVTPEVPEEEPEGRFRWRLESRRATSDEWSEEERGSREHSGRGEDVAYGVISDLRIGGQLREGRVYRLHVWSGDGLGPTAQTFAAVLTVPGGAFH